MNEVHLQRLLQPPARLRLQAIKTLMRLTFIALDRTMSYAASSTLVRERIVIEKCVRE